MQQIINFVIRNKTFLLFLLLFGISLILTIQSHSYHRSKFINSANSITGGVYGSINSIGQYLHLKKENDELIKENRFLRSRLFNLPLGIDSIFIDSTSYNSMYKIVTADVYKNSHNLTKNYLTLNKGETDGIQQDFGVITSTGIIGIIDKTSNHYSTVLSILNTKSRINAQLTNSSHIGSLIWNGKSAQYVQLIDVSKFAPVKVGDTIITGGQSTIFPKGIDIGKITSFTVDTSGDTYTIEVELFNDMTNIGHVYVIENLDKQEILTLQNTANE